MGVMRVACFGQKGNLLERAASVTVTSEHAQLTKDRLYDGRPSRAYRAASAATDLTITVDGTILLNGTLDSWPAGLPANWTVSVVGAGSAVVAEGAIKVAGANAGKLTAGNVGGASALISQTWQVRSGESRHIQAQLRGDGGSAATKMRVRNLTTGSYLQADLTWGAAAAVVLSQTPAAYALKEVTYTVEAFSVCGSDLATLQLEIYNDTQNTSTYVDEVADFPGVDFLSVHGHNIPPYIACEFRFDTAGFAGAGTLLSTVTKASPSFYVWAGLTYAQYWRVKLVGTPLLSTNIIEIGELVIAQSRQPLQAPEIPLVSGSRWDRQASVTPGGERHVHKRSKFAVRTRQYNFHFATQALYDDARELFHLRPEGDTYPIVIVPDTALPEVHHGRLRADMPDSRVFLSYYADVAVELEESPYASTAF